MISITDREGCGFKISTDLLQGNRINFLKIADFLLHIKNILKIYRSGIDQSFTKFASNNPGGH